MIETDKERWQARGEFEELKEELKSVQAEYKSFACRLRDITPPCDPAEYRKGIDLNEARTLIDKIEVVGENKLRLEQRIKEIRVKWNFKG